MGLKKTLCCVKIWICERNEKKIKKIKNYCATNLSRWYDVYLSAVESKVRHFFIAVIKDPQNSTSNWKRPVFIHIYIYM